MPGTDAGLAVAFPARARSEAPAGSFIVGPLYDSVFFIFTPLLALALGGALSLTPLSRAVCELNGETESCVSLFSGVFTAAHLVIVFFRSHGDRTIFRQHPKRFILAPLALFGAMMVSTWMLVFVFVLAVWWDVYHSSLQTFGLGRLYDRRAGNDADAGRGLDRWMNLLIYVGPIVGGVSLSAHVVHFYKFEGVGSAFFSAVPEFTETHAGLFNRAMILLGAAGLAAYAWGYARLIRAGYRVSWQKAALLSSTAACSLFAWGFNSFGQAFFIMNFFHSLQYFALIWWSENKNIAAVLGLKGSARAAALPLFVLLAFAYGVWAETFGQTTHAAMSLLLTVSILHFWYDGFIWSVRKGQLS
ncbi:MAG TPA: hypothetical protein VL404_05820 [Candidatus Eisenbacteria bacterium]|nr:hypothetical protein [Candidatus Eisenbacteria bacterium]